MKYVLSTTLLFALCGFASTSFSSVVTTNSPSSDSAVNPTPDAILAPLTYNGTTVGSPTFNRPVANANSAPTSLSGIGTAVSYDVVQFTIAATGTYNFLSKSVLSANWDNYTFLYSGTFNPSSPLSGVLIGNDDFPTIGISGFSYNLTAGSTYSFVTTGYSNTDAGTFNDSITQAVPEPGTWAMIGLGAVGLVALQRKRLLAV